MLVIPAIDLKDGKCVRLYQGRMDRAVVYAEDPLEMALRWQEEGAQRLHVVDLDGAVQGKRVNAPAVAAICRTVRIPVEVGGGIRDLRALEEVLDLGARWAILGTLACCQPTVLAQACQRFPGRVLASIDARGGKVAVAGWTQATEVEASDLGRLCAQMGVEAVVYTDIARDGAQVGVNVEAAAALARETRIPVIASGGVASLEDVRRLKNFESDGILGIIMGRALYTGAVSLKEALKEAQG